jgi:hypothetical protein
MSDHVGNLYNVVLQISMVREGHLIVFVIGIARIQRTDATFDIQTEDAQWRKFVRIPGFVNFQTVEPCPE